MLALAMVFGLEATMTAVATDAGRGITDRFRSLPMAPSAVVLGRFLADLAASVAGLLVLLAGGLAIGGDRVLPGRRWPRWGCSCCCGWPACGPASTSACSPATRPRWSPCRSWSGPSRSCPTPSSPPRHARLAGRLAEWNPLAATVTAVRELFGNPVGVGGGWPTEHALLLAVVWPVLIGAVFAVLSVRRYQALSR
jgi:hypothetical protein